MKLAGGTLLADLGPGKALAVQLAKRYSMVRRWAFVSHYFFFKSSRMA
jgi:hypothetical protein